MELYTAICFTETQLYCSKFATFSKVFTKNNTVYAIHNMVKQFITPLLRGVIFSERVTVGPRLFFPGGPIILGIIITVLDTS